MQNVTKLEISRANALKAYKGADEKVKSVLSDLFGKQVFTQDLTEILNTWEDFCHWCGEDPAALPFKNPTTSRQRGTNAFYCLDLIFEVLCDGVVLDYGNSNQPKWSPYLQYTAGSGFAFDGCGCDNAYTGVGSRLSADTEKKARFVAEKFPHLYNDLFIR